MEELWTPAGWHVVQIVPKDQANPHRLQVSDRVKITFLRHSSPGDELFYPKNEIQCQLSRTIPQGSREHRHFLTFVSSISALWELPAGPARMNADMSSTGL